MSDHKQFCQCCGRPIKGDLVWLELDMRDQKYKRAGEVPAEESQGGFPFGKTCAKRQLEAAE